MGSLLRQRGLMVVSELACGEIEALLQLAVVAVLQEAFDPLQPLLLHAGNPGL